MFRTIRTLEEHGRIFGFRRPVGPVQRAPSSARSSNTPQLFRVLTFFRECSINCMETRKEFSISFII